MTKTRAALVVALAAALALTTWGWLRVLQRGDWATGARRVAWRGPDGAALGADAGRSCRGSIGAADLDRDGDLDLIVAGEGVGLRVWWNREEGTGSAPPPSL